MRPFAHPLGPRLAEFRPDTAALHDLEVPDPGLIQAPSHPCFQGPGSPATLQLDRSVPPRTTRPTRRRGRRAPDQIHHPSGHDHLHDFLQGKPLRQKLGVVLHHDHIDQIEGVGQSVHGVVLHKDLPVEPSRLVYSPGALDEGRVGAESVDEKLAALREIRAQRAVPTGQVHAETRFEAGETQDIRGESPGVGRLAWFPRLCIARRRTADDEETEGHKQAVADACQEATPKG